MEEEIITLEVEGTIIFSLKPRVATEIETSAPQGNCGKVNDPYSDRKSVV